MENKSFKVLAIVALCVAVAGLSVAYAALSQTLNITGSAKAGASSTNWNVHFANGSCQTTGNAEAGSFSATGTTATLGESTFNAPGDTITCTFDVKNEGTIDAKITSVDIAEAANLTYTGSGDAQTADEALVKANTEYTVTYADDTPLAVDDTLDAGATKNLKLVLKYKDTAASLPQAEVAITNISGTIVYGQA